MSTKRIFGWVVVLIMLGTVAWADTPKQKLIGKWAITGKDAGTIVEFTADGKVNVTPPPKEPAMSGTYNWADNSSIDVTIKDRVERLQIAIDGDELTTTDHKGTADKFTRVK